MTRQRLHRHREKPSIHVARVFGGGSSERAPRVIGDASSNRAEVRSSPATPNRPLAQFPENDRGLHGVTSRGVDVDGVR